MFERAKRNTDSGLSAKRINLSASLINGPKNYNY
jgi:hypothetical protein